MFMYFDTEFTGLVKDASLISLGIVFENNVKYIDEDEYLNKIYCEFIDYDHSKVDEFVAKQVLPNTIMSKLDSDTIDVYKEHLFIDITHNSDDGNVLTLIGTKADISEMLKYTFEKIYNRICKPYDELIIPVSDVSYFDMVLFVDIFGGSMNLPEYITPACIDINQMIAYHYDLPVDVAFDMSREEIVRDFNPDLYDKWMNSSKIKKHNSLYDAEVIKAIHEELII